MSLYQELVANCANWEKYVKHDFGRHLVSGKLSYQGFANYLVQDYKYLVYYAKCFAILAYKSRTLAEMKYALKNAESVFGIEISMQEKFLDMGVIESQVPEHISCIAYTRYLTDIAMQGDYLDLMVALAPCFVGYGEMGNWIASLKIDKQNPYYEWAQVYGSQRYNDLCDEFIEHLNKLINEVTPTRFERLSRIFNDVVKLEIAFFDIALEEV